MKIERINNSKIDQIDFDNLGFGEVFTDHMFVCDYVDGEWIDPRIIPYQPINLDPSASVLHYGQAVFEGMKAYKDDQGKIWLFRPTDNHARINISSKRLAIPEFPKKYFMEGLNELLLLDQAWIRPGEGNSLYVRPFVFANQAAVSASPANRFQFIIICAPVKSYYSGELNVLISEKYSRAASGGVGFAKAAGNYAASFYPAKLAQEAGYQQIIWTDASTHEYIEESGTMNVFFRVGDTLITAPTTDTILDGITRRSILKIAEEMDLKVEIRKIRVDEIIQALEQGMLKEAFGVGTAVVVSPMNSIGFRDKQYVLPTLDDTYANRLKQRIVAIQYNREEDPYGWRIPVTTP